MPMTVNLPPPDTNGPVLTFPRYGSVSLTDGMVVSNSDTFAVTVSDFKSDLGRVLRR